MRGWDFIRDGAGAAEPRTGGSAGAGEAGPAVFNSSTILSGGSAAAAAEPSSSESAFGATGAEVMERGVDVSDRVPVAATPIDQVSRGLDALYMILFLRRA